MMKKKFSILVVLLCLLIQTAFSQTIDDGDSDESRAELEAQAIELLRETSAMATTLNSADNRIAFTLKTADILWEHDEVEAERLFRLTMEDTRRYIAQVNGELNQVEGMGASNWANAESSRVVRSKMNKVFSMISRLVNTLAKHDPEMAYQFLQEIKQIINNQELLRKSERTFKNLESSIAQKIAEQDPEKSLELAREKLAEGFSYQIGNLLSTIYRKDAKKGAAFGEDIIAKLKSSTSFANSTWLMLRLLRQGSSNFESLKKSNSNNPPMFSEQALRDLAEIISKQYLTNTTSGRSRRISSSNLALIEKYAPQQAAQIRQNQQQRSARGNSGGSSRGNGNSKPKSSFNSAMQKISKARREYQREIRKSVEALNAEGLTPEQKREIIQQTRGKILAVNNSDFRFSNLIWLATISKGIGEIEYAQMLLDQAEGFINRQPQVKNDFSKSRNLAAAYASIAPEKSFEIVEDMIYRLNDVIESYIRYSKYSSSRAIVENGELLVPRNSRQFTRYFSFSPAIYRALAESDFDRTRGLADKFSRVELRVETRLQIVGQLLKASKQNENNKGQMRTETKTID